MRVALLTMLEPAGAGAAHPRAYLRVAGYSLARIQLAMALQAGCERIVCHARGLDDELLALQHEVERAGARFHVIGSARGLSALVTATDEVLVMSEGLFAAPEAAIDLIGRGPVVLSLPAETAVPAGFERIDLETASAGLVLVPGRLVERLTELDPDSDPGSALLRIALQSGVPRRAVPDAVRAGRGWRVVRDDGEAQALEHEWLHHATADIARTPGQLLAAWGVRTFGLALVHGGNRNWLGGAALGLGLMGVGAAWFALAPLALGLWGAGWVMHRATSKIALLRRDAILRPRHRIDGEVSRDWALDAMLVAILVLSSTFPFELPVPARLFAPLMLVGLVRLASVRREHPAADWIADRFVLALLLAGLAAARALAPAVPLLALALIAGALVLAHAPSRITRA